ncbi:MAG TPA: hypothetical protein VGT41_02750 [Candidatus Babeliales bacterium]|nr:hypothetical protein [Candidatus Babeliales bacterium]
MSFRIEDCKSVFLVLFAFSAPCMLQAAASREDVEEAARVEKEYAKQNRLRKLRERAKAEKERLAPKDNAQVEVQEKKGILGRSLAVVKKVASKVGLSRVADEDEKEREDRKEVVSESDCREAEYRGLRKLVGNLSPDLRKYLCKFVQPVLTIFHVDVLKPVVLADAAGCAAAISPDSKYVAVGQGDRISVFDSESGRRIKHFRTERMTTYYGNPAIRIRKLAIGSGGRFVAVADREGYGGFVYDLTEEEPKLVSVLSSPLGNAWWWDLRLLEIDEDNMLSAVKSTFNGTYYRSDYNLATGEQIGGPRTLYFARQLLFNKVVVESANGQLQASVEADSTIEVGATGKIFRLPSFVPREECRSPRKSPTSRLTIDATETGIRISPDGSVIVRNNAPDGCSLWKPSGGKFIIKANASCDVEVCDDELCAQDVYCERQFLSEVRQAVVAEGLNMVQRAVDISDFPQPRMESMLTLIDQVETQNLNGTQLNQCLDAIAHEFQAGMQESAAGDELPYMNANFLG